MRRAMEYVRWELDNWRTQRHGRDRSIFTETKKVASYMWQSWKRGALVVLVLAFLPILFPLVLFLSFVGFISVVLLLCGAATYYLLFRSFSLPLSITELFKPSNRPLEGLITCSHSGEGRILESLPFVVQEVESRQDDSSLKTSAIGKDSTENPGRLSDAKTFLLLECELVAGERDEADNREHHRTFKLNVPFEGNQRNSASGAGSSSSVRRHSNAVLQVRGPTFLLPSAKLKSQYEQRKDKGIWSLNGTGEVADVSSNGFSKSGCQKAPTGGMMDSEKEADAVSPNRTCAHSSPTVTFVEANYLVQGLGPAEFPLDKSFPTGEHQMYSGISEAIEDEPTANVISPSSEKSKSSTKISTIDVPFSGLLEDGHIFESVRGTACTPQRRHITETDKICDICTCHRSSTVEGYEEYPTAASVFIAHTVTVAPTAESSETSGHFRGHALNGKDRSVGKRTLTGNSELNTEASANSTSIPFSYPALLTTPEGIACVDSKSVTPTVPARYWRDEVEDIILSSAFANIACMENRSSGASGDMASPISSKSESEKLMMSDQDGVCVLECAGEAEVFSALQTPNSGQYKERMVEGENRRTGSSLRFATSPFTHQRRLSFNNILVDDEMENPRFFLPREKFNDLTLDCKKRSVSTSFSSDYTWPSESSEQGLEFLSTRGTAYEESCIDTSSSASQYEEESDLELGVVSNSTFFPTPNQLTEDWKTRRKRWEEESTLGRLAPLSPYMEAHSVEARLMCNPLFEFSTPSPPLKKLKTGNKNHNSNSPSFHTRFSKRHSAPPEILRTQTWSSGSTLSPRQLKVQDCKSGLYAERLESNTSRHARSYSASFTESMEPYSGEFEGLLGYWWKRDRTAHSLTSSPRHYSTATSPAEVAHQIREEIDTKW